MNNNDMMIERLAKLVSSALTEQLPEESAKSECACNGAKGCLFEDVNEAVETAAAAQKIYGKMSMKVRKQITDAIVEHVTPHIRELSEMGVKETGMGNVEDKVLKHHYIMDGTPSIEMLKPQVFTGDNGVTLVEMSPFGVIGAITPSTNPSETIINNSISMLAAGNSVVFSPHPGAKDTTNRCVELVAEAVVAAGGPKGLVCSILNPDMDKSKILMSHPKVNMLCATGGPGVVKAVLSSGKKAIGAGEGNPPVLVDDTVSLDKAAKDIVNGCSFDNNLPCIAEKSVVVVDHVANELIACMEKHGAYLLTDQELIRKITETVIPDGKNPNRKFVGRSAITIMERFGVKVPANTKVIIFEAPEDHTLVVREQLMPILPIVRVPDVDYGIDLCCRIENGRRHSALCHSTDIRVLTEYARRVQTTIFVKNGSSFCGSGAGGEGYATATIAGPTGEGLTTCADFTRKRRCVIVDSFNIR